MKPIIHTMNIKPEQLIHGTYQCGTGPEVILVMGSCRSIPYLNYFNQINLYNRFTVHYLDPFNWHWDLHDERVDYHHAIEVMESHPEMLKTLESVDWFIHEHYENFGMFNTNREKAKHIYQYGLKPELDISIPNFHDVFILFQDFMTFDEKLREKARIDIANVGVIMDDLQAEITNRANANIERFVKLCDVTSFPHMGERFMNTWKRIRYFWTFNHVSSHFTTEIFRSMCNEFLNIEVPKEFWLQWIQNDMFRNVITPLTKYDIANHKILWSDPVEELKL